MGLSKSLTNWVKKTLVVLITITAGWLLIYRIIPPPVTMTMIQNLFTQEGSLQYRYVNNNHISAITKVCAMASEDQNLPFHKGIDLDAIGNAIQQNKSGKKTFGASTISQQVAKNVFLFQNRSYLRKVLELYFTVWIETLWPKDKILEMYLNVAEMGTLIFGVNAAAEYYFNKPASQLNLRESASLISILPNPKKYKIKNPGNYVSGRIAQILSLYRTLDGKMYLRELYVQADNSLYDFSKYNRK